MKKKQILITICQTCGKTYLPTRTNCPDCVENGKIEEIPLSNRGKLYTYTISYIKQIIEFTGKLPYVSGIIEFPENFDPPGLQWLFVQNTLLKSLPKNFDTTRFNIVSIKSKFLVLHYIDQNIRERINNCRG